MNVKVVEAVGEIEFAVNALKKGRALVLFCDVNITPTEMRFYVVHGKVVKNLGFHATAQRRYVLISRNDATF